MDPKTKKPTISKAVLIVSYILFVIALSVIGYSIHYGKYLTGSIKGAIGGFMSSVVILTLVSVGVGVTKSVVVK